MICRHGRESSVLRRRAEQRQHLAYAQFIKRPDRGVRNQVELI
jgi:hypothetical protein